MVRRNSCEGIIGKFLNEITRLTQKDSQEKLQKLELEGVLC